MGSDGGCFHIKRPKRGSVNSVFMRFSIAIFPGKVSDFRLKGGGGGAPPVKALGGVTSPYPLGQGGKEREKGGERLRELLTARKWRGSGRKMVGDSKWKDHTYHTLCCTFHCMCKGCVKLGTGKKKVRKGKKKGDI